LYCVQKKGGKINFYKNGYVITNKSNTYLWEFGTVSFDDVITFCGYIMAAAQNKAFNGEVYYSFFVNNIDPSLMVSLKNLGIQINNKSVFDFDLQSYKSSDFVATNHIISIAPMVQSKYDTNDSLTKMDVITLLAYRATPTNIGAENGYLYNSGRGYIKLNTANSRISLGDITQLNSSQKFSFFGTLSSDNISANGYIFGKNSEANFSSYTYGGRLYFHLGGTFYCYTELLSGYILSGYEFKIKWVYDGSLTGNANRIKIYINDVLLSLTFSGTIPATTPNLAGSPFIIGDLANNYSFKGKLFSFSIFNDALTDDQQKVVESLMPNWYGYSATDNSDGSMAIKKESSILQIENNQFSNNPFSSKKYSKNKYRNR
jgi:hypothetical protein